MKNKLRKIIIDGIEYKYKFSYSYFDNSEKCKSIIKVFKGEGKNNALTFNMETFADAIIGNPLNVGISIDNDENINLNCPKWVRLIILYGIKIGWDGGLRMTINGDYDLLKQINE